MVFSKELESIKNDILRRMRDELLDHNIEIKTVIFREINENRNEKKERINKYLNETTKMTTNERDVIGIKNLWDLYEEWNYANEGTAETSVTGGANEMGKYMAMLQYDKAVIQIHGKTIRGYKNLRFKTDDESKVKEFMERYTERTEKKEDNIKIEKLVRKYNEEYKPRCNLKRMKEELINNEYKTKTCYETKENQEKNRKGFKEGNEAVPCVKGVKWKEFKEKCETE